MISVCPSSSLSFLSSRVFIYSNSNSRPPQKKRRERQREKLRGKAGMHWLRKTELHLSPGKLHKLQLCLFFFLLPEQRGDLVICLLSESHDPHQTCYPPQTLSEKVLCIVCTKWCWMQSFCCCFFLSDRQKQVMLLCLLESIKSSDKFRCFSLYLIQRIELIDFKFWSKLLDKMVQKIY